MIKQKFNKMKFRFFEIQKNLIVDRQIMPIFKSRIKSIKVFG